MNKTQITFRSSTLTTQANLKIKLKVEEERLSTQMKKAKRFMMTTIQVLHGRLKWLENLSQEF